MASTSPALSTNSVEPGMIYKYPMRRLIERFLPRRGRPRLPFTIGLALGSGSARGIAHIAVCDYLRLIGLPVDLVAGSSIGAVVGALYCLGRLDVFKRDAFRFSKIDVARLADFGINRSGLMDGSRLTSFLSKYIPPDTRIEQLAPRLAVVATDLATGRPVVFTQGNLLTALRASFSIPGILTPVAYEKTHLVDGGVAAPVPVDIACQLGATAVIAVNLLPGPTAPPVLQPATAPAEPAEIPAPGIIDVIIRSLDVVGIQALAHTLRQYPPSVLIEPDVGHIYSFDYHRAEEIYGLGMAAARRKTDQLLQLKSRIVRRSRHAPEEIV